MIQKPMDWRIGICTHCWGGLRNQRLSKVGIYFSLLHHFTFVIFAPQHFKISPFHYVNMGVYSVQHFTILVSQLLCINTFHHLKISPFEDECVFSAPFCHICFTLALYQSISPSPHLTFLPLFHNFIAKRRKKSASEQRDNEIFGFCSSDERESDEDVGEKNGAE